MNGFASTLNRLVFMKNNYSLKSSSPMAFDGKAEFYSEPNNINELMDVLESAYKMDIPVSCIGSGTNTLISDRLIEGLVISTKRLRGVTMKGALLECLPGEMLTEVIDKSIEHQLIGMEKLAGIPGTIAGAMNVNAEANGISLSDFVYYFDFVTYNGTLKRVANYSDTFSSQTLNMPEDGIITNIALRLNPSKATAEARIRKEMYVELLFIPPCSHFIGQVFKDTKDKKAADIIKELRLDRIKGYAEYSSYQPNCIFSYPGCKANDVYELIKRAERDAKKELGIRLERSISLLGKFY